MIVVMPTTDGSCTVFVDTLSLFNVSAGKVQSFPRPEKSFSSIFRVIELILFCLHVKDGHSLFL